MLVHHPDPQLERVMGGLDVGWLTSDEHGAGVREDVAEHDVHERGLAGSVLTEQDVNLTGPDIKVDAVVGLDVAKPLGNAVEFYNALNHSESFP